MIEVKPQTIEYYDFMEMRNAIEEKHNINLRDVKGKYKNLNAKTDEWKEWLVSEFGKTYEDLKKELGNVNQEWATTYKMPAYLEEKYPELEYCDFWHWCLELWDGQFEKGKPINWVDWNHTYEWASKPHYWNEKDDYVQPEWVLNCIKLFADEFGHLGEHTIIVDW